MKFNREKFLSLNPSNININLLAKILLIPCFLLNLFVSSYLLLSNMDARGVANKDIDFLAYITGAYILKNNPKDLYNLDVQKKVQEEYTGRHFAGILSFRNTPTTALMFVPFANMDKGAAYKANYYLQSILTLGFIFLLYKTFKPSLLMLPIAFVFFPSAYQQTNGQMMPVLISLILLGLYFSVKSKRIFLAGMISALLIFKIQFAPIIPFIFIFLNDKKRYLYGFISVSLALLFFDSFLYHGFYFFDYIKFIFKTESYGTGTNLPTLYNLTAFFNLYGINYFYSSIISGAIYLAVLLYAFFNKSKYSFERYFTAAVLLTFSLTIHSQLVDLIILLIPMVLISKWPGKLKYLFVYILFIIPLACLSSLIHFQGIMAYFMFLMGVFILFTDSRAAAVKAGVFSSLPK